jgi:heptosyltransferase-1
LIAAAGGSSEVERLLIVRLSAMGDVIHTLPTAHALRDVFPNATISWLIEERWADLLCAPGTPRRGPRSDQRPLVDWVHTVDLKEWRTSLFAARTAERIARVWNDVRSSHYDLVLDLQGAIRSAILARWSGAAVIFGAAQPRETPASLFYTRPVIVQGSHVVEQNLSIAEAFVGRKLSLPAVELPRDDAAEGRVTQKLREASIRDFAVLNPGAGWGAKRWPAERYGRVARAVAAEGLRSIINHGPGEESLAREVEAASEGTASPFPCSISELIVLTRRAKLFIGGDTGPMHLAAALKVPVVAIFGPTDPARNGPYGTRSVVLRNSGSSTSHARIAQPDQAMLEIPVDAVIDAAQTLLSEDASPSPTETAHG